MFPLTSARPFITCNFFKNTIVHFSTSRGINVTVKETTANRISKSLNEQFDRQFPNPQDNTNTLNPFTSSSSSYSNSPPTSTSNFTQPIRSYRDDLYAARRIDLSPTQQPSTAFRKLQTLMNDEGVLQRVKAKRYFVRPGLLKHAEIYGGRRKKFNRKVSETIQKIMEIQSSQE